ncbi:MAG: hypothetical protein QOC58_1396, partial [Mycobacterium sp.]|nr:hypothetical protein [Mycobacterium sp.]
RRHLDDVFGFLAGGHWMAVSRHREEHGGRGEDRREGYRRPSSRRSRPG